MKRVELYGRVRHAVMIEGLSQREAARCFGIDPRTVRKMLSYSVPPGYVRTRPPVRPKLDPFIGIIDRILEEDKDRPKKQRHTSKRIFERLRDEYSFTGKITIVKDYICGVRQRRREMFVPLTHPPGHAQVDFGEALAVIGGVERKIHFLAMSLPHSDACFVKAYPGETTEAFCDGHVSGFSFFGGVPRSILYDNTRINAQVLHCLQSKYAIKLYEMIERRRNLDFKQSDNFTVEDFRAILNIPKGKLKRFADMNKYAIKPAIEELNHYTDFSVTIEPIEFGPRRKVLSVCLFWMMKSKGLKEEARAELDKHSAGRRARLKDNVEEVVFS